MTKDIRAFVRQSPDGNIRAVAWEPGNGTRYEVYASRAIDLREDADSPERLRGDRWIVTWPEWGGGYYIHEGHGIDHSYVMEKFPGRAGRTLSAVDASELARCIAALVPGCRAYGCTDDKGQYVY